MDGETERDELRGEEGPSDPAGGLGRHPRAVVRSHGWQEGQRRRLREEHLRGPIQRFR